MKLACNCRVFVGLAGCQQLSLHAAESLGQILDSIC